MPIKRNSLPNRSTRHFGIKSKHFHSNHFNEVNKFIEDKHKYFYPPEDPDHYRFHVGNEHELVEDVEPQTLIKLVKFLKRDKAPCPDTIHNEVLRLGTTTSLLHYLDKLFYVFHTTKLHPNCMENSYPTYVAET